LLSVNVLLIDDLYDTSEFLSSDIFFFFFGLQGYCKGQISIVIHNVLVHQPGTTTGKEKYRLLPATRQLEKDNRWVGRRG
jgi:hypothetical protein